MSQQLSSQYLANLDNSTLKQRFRRRLGEYACNNFGFSIYYDKVHKKEYLPSRVRYNQFFFYSVLFYFVFKQAHTRWQLVDERQKDLGKRRYFTLPRTYSNPIARSRDHAALQSHVAQQKYIL
eukprot:403359914